MILSCSNLEKSFDGNTIFKNCSFFIEDNEKAAIVGINGAGKTTLLRTIMGEIAPDNGAVTFAKDKTVGYLAQYQDISGSNTVYEEMLDAKREVIEIENNLRLMEERMNTVSGDELEALMDSYSKLHEKFELADGYKYKSEINGVLKGLGFDEEQFSTKIGKLSGGQKTRCALAKMLISDPDLILLDEPTNHLDIASITWLETYLCSYRGAVVIVAHDRYFLDKVVTKVVEIDRSEVRVFSGNYSEYAAKKQALREAMMRAYLNNQREIKHQEAVIEKLRSFNREKSIKRADSREKMLEKMEVIQKPDGPDASMKIELTPRTVSGKDVLDVKNLSKAFGEKVLFTDLSFEIKRGERTAIIGENGTGKTTILKIINGLIPADSGEFTLGAKVCVGYYDQEQQILNPKLTIFDEISAAYPTLTNTEIRNMLASFLFTGEEVFKLIGDLSGGERARVSLAKLMLSEANFLILDEPTNHLDMDSKEILENAIKNYTGTVLYVSHDRYFINATATRILNLEDRRLTNYVGNYDYYLEKRSVLQEKVETLAAQKPKNSEGREDWQTMKERAAGLRKLENDLKKTEERIADIEGKLAAYDEELTREEVYTDVSKCMEIHKACETLKEELDGLYKKWEELAEIMAERGNND